MKRAVIVALAAALSAQLEVRAIATPEQQTTSARSPQQPAAGGLPQVSNLPLKLLGLVVDREEPAKSACLIRCLFDEEKEARLVAGQRACEVADVEEVRADGVRIRNILTNRSEWLPFTEAASQPRTTVAPAPPLLSSSSEGISVGMTNDSVNYYLGNLTELLDSALATPHYRDTPGGRVMEGYDLTEIKDGSLAHQVGLRDGDLVVAVNGKPLDSLATVLALLAQADKTPQIKMAVVRKGERLTFVVNTKEKR